MRVLQVIDSLESGGAEIMALNYANGLSEFIEESHLCCTRKEGILKKRISKEVSYIFLEKKSTVDFKAFINLKNYIDKNRIDIVQAHSSSYFLVTLMKLLSKKKFKLIWHDHYGNSEFLNKRPYLFIKFFSKYFDGIISVNQKLKAWACSKLSCNNIQFFKNFVIPENNRDIEKTILRGGEDFKFICVANLRPQKDHLNLIKAFELFKGDNVSLHFVGKNFDDNYFSEVISGINKSPKSDEIYYYGNQNNIQSLLSQADVGVLSSRSEGLPIALIEYGLAGLPVISTKVGEVETLLAGKGILVNPNDSEDLGNKMFYLYSNADVRQDLAEKFRLKIQSEYLYSQVLPEILNFYQKLIEN